MGVYAFQAPWTDTNTLSGIVSQVFNSLPLLCNLVVTLKFQLGGSGGANVRAPPSTATRQKHIPFVPAHPVPYPYGIVRPTDVIPVFAVVAKYASLAIGSLPRRQVALA